MAKAKTLEAYITAVPAEQQLAFLQLRATIAEHIPDGFEECLNYGMLGRVVPHSIYPDGYHCDPKLPLPFLNLAYQKKSVNLYHMGIYAQQDLLERFQNERIKRDLGKLDMGKSCIRFKKYDQIPYDLIGSLIEKISVQKRIRIYEKSRKKQHY